MATFFLTTGDLVGFGLGEGEASLGLGEATTGLLHCCSLAVGVMAARARSRASIFACFVIFVRLGVVGGSLFASWTAGLAFVGVFLDRVVGIVEKSFKEQRA